MALLDSLATYLAAQGHGTLAVDIWISQMQDSDGSLTATDTAICLYEYEGQRPMQTMGASTPIQLERPRVQVVARAADYQTARTKLAAVRTTLAGITDQTLSGIRILRVDPAGSIVPLPDDEKNRQRLAASFNVVHA